MRMPFTPEHDSRANNFDCIRLLLALLVLFSHCFSVTGGMNSNDPLSQLTGKQLSFGDVAVDGFFIISGFLVTSSLVRSKSIWSYLKKRILRIYPGFVCATLLTLGLVLFLSAGRIEGRHRLGPVGMLLWRMVSLDDLAYKDIFMRNPYPGVVNVSLWTIRLEFICYLGLGILSLCGILRRRSVCLLLFILSMALSIGLVNSNLISRYSSGVFGIGAALWPFLVRLVPAYMAGVVGYLYFERFVISIWLSLIALATIVISVFISHGLLIAIPVSGTYILFALAFNRSIRLSDFARYGDFSYGTYLYAFPIQQVFESCSGGSISWVVLCLTSVPTTIAVAAASWHLVEKRFLPRSRVVSTKQMVPLNVGVSQD